MRHQQALHPTQGRMVQSTGTHTAAFFEQSIKDAVEWSQTLGIKNQLRRYAAVSLFKELAENAPSLFFLHVRPFFEHVGAVLNDETVWVREGGVLALHAVLASIAAQRKTSLCIHLYHKVYQDILNVSFFCIIKEGSRSL